MVNPLKNSKLLLLFLFLGLIIYLFLGWIIYGWYVADETQFRYFQDFQDLRTQGGWMPNLVPDSSTEINLEYEIDSNAHWMRFRAIPSAMQPVFANGEEITGSEKEDLGYLSPFVEVDWWFANVNDVVVYKVDNEDSTQPTYVAVSDDFYYLWVEGS